MSQNKSCDKSFEKEIFVRLQNGVRHVEILGSGSGAVGREVAYDTWDQRFESSHQHFYLVKTVFKLYCKEETKRKRGQEWLN